MYKNPVPIERSFKTGPNDIRCNPDPFVIRYCGRYYCYSSGEEGISLLTSDDLTSFHHKGFAYANSDEHSYWAPAVFYYNGLFYLYYSSLLQEESDDHHHYLRVAQSYTPEGPFQYVSTLIHDFAIDPHVFKEDNKIFLLYSRNVTTGIERIGTVITLDRMLSPIKPAGESRDIILPSLDEEIFARNRFGDGHDWHTLEGGFFYKRGGRRFILYSGNAYTSPNYFIGYAAASRDTPLMSSCFTKYPNANTFFPLVSSSTYIKGTGHNSIVKAPDNMTDMIVYHGVPADSPSDGLDHRQLCIDKIVEKGGKLYTQAPSSIYSQSISGASYSTSAPLCGAKPWQHSSPNSNPTNVLTGCDRLSSDSKAAGKGILDTWLKLSNNQVRLVLSPSNSFLLSSDGEEMWLKTEASGHRYIVPETDNNPQAFHHLVIEWQSGHYMIYFDEIAMCSEAVDSQFGLNVSVENICGLTELGSVELTVIE